MRKIGDGKAERGSAIFRLRRGSAGFDKNAENTYFQHMKATLSELHRETRRIVRPVIHAGEEVVLTDFGRPVARIIPYLPTETVSPDEARASGELSDAAILAGLEESRFDRSEESIP